MEEPAAQFPPNHLLAPSGCLWPACPKRVCYYELKVNRNKNAELYPPSKQPFSHGSWNQLFHDIYYRSFEAADCY
ncbi:MAG: hypothetical protein HYW48_06635 [Deltaproteobacteria bacterium]|nr:hypothetical protein [Deltaproteobacteria bacterium]